MDFYTLGPDFTAAQWAAQMMLQRDRARRHRAILAGACVALFGAFLLAAYEPRKPAYCEPKPASVLQLDPTVIRADRAEVYEL